MPKPVEALLGLKELEKVLPPGALKSLAQEEPGAPRLGGEAGTGGPEMGGPQEPPAGAEKSVEVPQPEALLQSALPP